MRYLLFALLLGLCSPVSAQTVPEAVVQSFYEDYTLALEHNPPRWVQTLVANQKAHLESELGQLLVRLADGEPGGDGPWLDFDPFSNSQVGVDDYRILQASYRQGLAYVPVEMKLSRDNVYRLRTRVVLRQHGSEWKIANFAYPAEGGMEGWDLRGYLRESFQR